MKRPKGRPTLWTVSQDPNRSVCTQVALRGVACLAPEAHYKGRLVSHHWPVPLLVYAPKPLQRRPLSLLDSDPSPVCWGAAAHALECGLVRFPPPCSSQAFRKPTPPPCFHSWKKQLPRLPPASRPGENAMSPENSYLIPGPWALTWVTLRGDVNYRGTQDSLVSRVTLHTTCS